MAANGRNLVQIIASENVENIGTEDIWPKAGELNPAKGEFDSSTSYFAWLITNQILNVHWNFFAGGEMPSAESMEEFIGVDDSEEGRYTAWCIVGNVDESMPGNTPVLFSRNLGKDGNEKAFPYSRLSMKRFHSQAALDLHFLADGLFDKEDRFVFICKDGSAYAPIGEDMKLQNFTNIFVIPPEAEGLPILRPNAADSGL